MPVYPGTEPPSFTPANSYEKDGFKETKISMFTHTGTHMDPIADTNLTRHKQLFQNTDIVNIENLNNLGLCGNDLFWFSCFPLKLENCDGSPIRAVAWFE